VTLKNTLRYLADESDEPDTIWRRCRDGRGVWIASARRCLQDRSSPGFCLEVLDILRQSVHTSTIINPFAQSDRYINWTPCASGIFPTISSEVPTIKNISAHVKLYDPRRGSTGISMRPSWQTRGKTTWMRGSCSLMSMFRFCGCRRGVCHRQLRRRSHVSVER